MIYSIDLCLNVLILLSLIDNLLVNLIYFIRGRKYRSLELINFLDLCINYFVYSDILI